MTADLFTSSPDAAAAFERWHGDADLYDDDRDRDHTADCDLDGPCAGDCVCITPCDEDPDAANDLLADARWGL